MSDAKSGRVDILHQLAGPGGVAAEDTGNHFLLSLTRRSERCRSGSEIPGAGLYERQGAERRSRGLEGCWIRDELMVSTGLAPFRCSPLQSCEIGLGNRLGSSTKKRERGSMSGRLRELVRPWFHLRRRESLEKRKEARDAAVFISSLVLAVVFGVLPMPVVWKWLGWFLCFWGSFTSFEPWLTR